MKDININRMKDMILRTQIFEDWRLKPRLDVITITPTTAVVCVDMENDTIGADYTDFHTLTKLDSTWYILSKV
jgi:hypothetical protein